MAVDLHADVINYMSRSLGSVRWPRIPYARDWFDEQPKIAPESTSRRWANLVEVQAHHRVTESETTFAALAEQWRNETGMMSSVAKRAMYSAYQRIIGMGPAVIPLVLRELEERPDHWFWALTYLTGEHPAESATNFDEARSAWLRWGRGRGYIK